MSAIALTFLVLTAGDSTSSAAAATPEMGKPKFKHARFEKEIRRPEGKYGFCPSNVTPPPACSCPCPCPRIEQRTVLVPQWVTECKKVPATEIRHEERDREIVTYKDAPETVARTRTVTVMERQVRSHQEKYTVERPVTEKVEQRYTVCIPYTETRTATRTVLKPVWTEVERKYTVCVPYCEKRTGLRTVAKCVPVVRTREICVDQGHWEERISKPICKPICKPVCNVCEPCAPPVTVVVPVVVCKTRVWVPCVVHKTESYTVNTTEMVQVPYTYEVKLERPEVRTKIEKVRTMVPTPEPYSYEVQLTRHETRTRFVDVCRMVPEVRTRIVNETVCVPREKCETYNVTVVRRVAVKRIVKECFDVPVCTTREVQVRVRKLVPKTVDVQVAVRPVCAVCAPACGCK